MAVEAQEKYCPICGKDAGTPQFKRFGEFCCSEAHAEEYVKEVRTQKQAAATPQGRPMQEEVGHRRGGCC